MNSNGTTEFFEAFRYKTIFIQKVVTSCGRGLIQTAFFTLKRIVKEPGNKFKNDQIISLSEARKILNRNGNIYSDSEITKIRDFLIRLAELQHSNQKLKENETGNSLYPSID